MRPKKVILVLADRPELLEEWRYLLLIQKFRPVCETLTEAHGATVFVRFDAALLLLTEAQASVRDLVRRLRRNSNASSPTGSIVVHCKPDAQCRAALEETARALAAEGARVCPASFDHALLLEALRAAAARKRGPRKGQQRRERNAGGRFIASA